MAAFPATGGHAPPRRRSGARPAGWTGDKRQLFLAMLCTCLNVRRAVDSVGLSASGVYQLKRRDPAFARAWVEALDEGYSNLELEMLRQAIEGCEKTETVMDTREGPVRQVKVTHSYPHNVAMWLLRAHRDEVEAFRMVTGRERDEADLGARMRAQMDIVRARLLGEADQEHGITQDSGADDDG